MAKTEVRRELEKSFVRHWVNAFMTLEYKPELTDKQNEQLFFDWAFSGIRWEDVKKKLALEV